MQKQTVIFEENPKWQIYKGKFFCQIGPLSRDRARILYLIILCSELNELNVDNWSDNCETKSEAKSPRPLRGFQVDSSLTRNVSYAVR